MQIEVSQIPHRYRNRFLRDNSGSVTVNKNSTSNSASNSFYPVNIWGQYFDDTEDINGDFNTRGSVYADGSLNVGGDSSLNYVVTESIEPRQTNLYSLGSISKKWKNLFAIDASIDNLDSQNINTHNLTVTGTAHFFQLVIDKLKSVGGTVILSAANATIDKVESVSGGYKLWWRKEDNEREKAISNDFKVNDQVICQSFNAQTGISHNVSNRYYWRLVTAVGDGSTTIDGETKDCNYIIVSDTVKDGSSIPEVGDEIMQLGYRGTDDDERQSAIILSAYKSPDSTVKAPAMAQYVGINDFNLSNHKYTWFAANGNNIRGNLKVTSGTTVEDLISQMSVDEDEIIARINSSLGPTGIDIVNQKITLTAANTVINGNLNLYDSNNSGFTVYDDTNTPRVNIQSDAVGNITTIANDTYQYLNLSKSGTVTVFDLTTNETSFSLSQYDTIDLDRFSAQFYTSSGGSNTFPTFYTMTLKAIITLPDSSTKTYEVTITKADSYGNYRNLTDKIRYSAPTAGTYKLKIRVYSSQSASGTAYLNVNVRCQTAKNAQTFIGRDGFYTHQGANKLIWASEDELQLRYGFSGIRWNNPDSFRNQNFQVAAQIKGTSPNVKPVWFPFYNYTPLFQVGTGTTPYLYTYQFIGNINASKWAFRIDEQRDSGICYVVGRAMDSDNYQDSWIVLPPETFTDSDGDTVGLPVGYTVTIINDSGGNVYVVPYSNTEHGVIIVDSNLNDNYFCELNAELSMSNDTYIYVGAYAGGRHWRALHDTQ